MSAEKKKLVVIGVKLDSVSAKIQSIARFGREAVTDPSKVALFRGMMDEIRNHYKDFKEHWNSLIETHVEAGSIDTFPSAKEKSSQQDCDRYYYEALSTLKTLEASTTMTTTDATNSESQSFSISRSLRIGNPADNLPKFDGTMEKWPFYRDTFTAMVHRDETIPTMEKYRALLTSLDGPALTMIKSLPILEANYDQAWKLLNDHYDNKRILGASYLRKVLEFKPLLETPNLSTLHSFIANVCETIIAFNHLKIPNSSDFILLTLAMRCIDQRTRHAFERKHLEAEFPSFNNFYEFLKGECMALTLSGGEVTTKSSSANGNQRSNKQPGKTALFSTNKGEKTTSTHNQRQITTQCPACDKKHTLYQCELFRAASATERFEMLKKWSGCRNCLSSQHNTRTCPSENTCNTCGKKHHTWIHLPEGNATQRVVSNHASFLDGSMTHDSVVLGTVVGQIMDNCGQFHNIRIVLDSGSQYSFITDACARRLGFQPDNFQGAISGIGHVAVANTHGVLNCTLRSSNGDPTLLSTRAIILKRITGNLPQITMSQQLRKAYQDFPLADKQFWKCGPIEFLMGSDLFYDVISGKPIHVAPNLPKVMPTIFGYVVGGRFQKPIQQNATSLFVQNDELAEIMKRFWSVEEVEERKLTSPDDSWCEDHFLRTHYRTSTGRYVVSLPFKQTPPNLSSSRYMATKRFHNLEGRLSKDPDLKSAYAKFMQEYIDLQHMSKGSSQSSAYTIPHHAVFKTNEFSPKLRVVFDASCSTTNGSLNDYLHAGPRLQNDIGIIILRFRRHPVVFTTDIVKMFRQILINPTDRKFQHILWRFDRTHELSDYQLDTVTYGTKPAPYLAIRTLHQLVKDEGNAYPLASSALIDDCYVDDIATGSDSVDNALILKEQLIQLLEKGGFELSKWSSNHPQLLGDESSSQNPLSLSPDDQIIKILGLQWDPVKDAFTYNIDVPPSTPTKRSILSAIARIFDPLGYLSPVICFAKIILQTCWKEKVDWDQPLPSSIADVWFRFVEELPQLRDVVIPRLIDTTHADRIDVVGFCDSSQLAYSASIYLRLVFGTDDIKVHLVKAKTKLAPIKPLTIPRLELSAALLLSRMFKSLKDFLCVISPTNHYWFSDSTIVLGWLSTDPSVLKTFVAHRVVEINETTQTKDWHHVSTLDNPADCSSRGLSPSDFINHTLWKNGPHWLQSPLQEWPIVHVQQVELQSLPEVKGAACLSSQLASQPIIAWIETLSSYPRLCRIISYILRFLRARVGWPSGRIHTSEEIARSRVPGSIQEILEEVPPISAREYRQSTTTLIKIVQSHYFANLIDKSKGLNQNLHILRLNPFVDKTGVLRVGGRLNKAPLPEGVKHPILLPGKCHFTRLLIDHYHRMHLHIGPSALQALLRNSFWILSARLTVRQRIFRCADCFKLSQQPKAPFMGDLPRSRFAEGRAFLEVGVDFAGPLQIRASLRRKAQTSKAYLCLFICMASKALHLELVSDLSTPAFLAALDRFIARRGLPVRIHSDCGTNFVGACRELKELRDWYRQKDTGHSIIQHLAIQGVEWSFNPPSSPNFGGLWEANIKMTKRLMHHTFRGAPQTFEELSTLLCRIEAVLNSRPICPLSEDPESLEALTPGHFLVGAPLISRPEIDLLDLPVNRLSRWQLVQQRVQFFWKRWRQEYIHQLQLRNKWTQQRPNLEIGELVLLKEPKEAPSTWTLARVVNTRPGADGITRVAEIRTARGLLTRPVSKLVPLKPITTPESLSSTPLTS